MDAKVQAFLDNLTRTQFADMKGSQAKMHLVLSEVLLNKVVGIIIGNPSMEKNYPMLALVKEAKVSGSLTIDVKLNP